MPSRRLAVFADIHGNSWALQAVFADCARRGITQGFVLGDTLYGPLNPLGTCALLKESNITLTHIKGNSDRELFESSLIDATSPTMDYTRNALHTECLNWLSSAPAIYMDDDICACHGTPDRDTAYLLEQMSEHGGVLRATSVIAKDLRQVSQRLILCGHSHLPRIVSLPNGVLVINPGSVGLPAYRDEVPVPHIMEAGSPHARYAILEHTDTEWRIELIALAYDWHTAARAACSNGRPDWATYLESGRA